MKATILNGSGSDDGAAERVYDRIVSELSDAEWKIKPFILRDLSIAYCLGCFECWVKTPGECRHNDDGREIARQFIQSDLAILFTPVTFGGYSSELKKGLDRIICLISPFFTKRNGEIHHKPRYERYPALLVVGVLPQADEESEQIFRTLTERNALNLMPPVHTAGILFSNQSEDQVRKEIKSLLAAVGVKQ